MQCCDEKKYEKVWNLKPDVAGNMYFRGDWRYNPEYNTGDVVIFSGRMYLARKHSAGKDPSMNPKYWKRLGADAPEPKPPAIRHVLNGGAAALKEGVPSYEFQLRIDSALNWEATNPILGFGEPGIDATNFKLKIGNGLDRWNELPYVNCELYELLDHETQERVTQMLELRHRLEDNELSVSQEMSDMKQFEQVIASSFNTQEYKRLLYEHRINAKFTLTLEKLQEEVPSLNDLKRRLNEAISGVTEDGEILDARVDLESEVYPTLGENIRQTQGRLKALGGRTWELQSQIDDTSEAVMRLIELLWKTDARDKSEIATLSERLEEIHTAFQTEKTAWDAARASLRDEFIGRVSEVSRQISELEGKVTGIHRERQPCERPPELRHHGHCEPEPPPRPHRREPPPLGRREVIQVVYQMLGRFGLIDDVATDEEVEEMLNEVFGVPAPAPEPEPEPNPEPEDNPEDKTCCCKCDDGTATDEEVEEMLNDVFGLQTPEPPAEPKNKTCCCEGDDDTATDDEVNEMFTEVFGF